MAVITDAERKKQRNREVKREYYAKNKEKRWIFLIISAGFSQISVSVL